MYFREEEVENFLNFFETVKYKIRAMPGCEELRLLRDLHNPSILSTYSIWNEEADLNFYRNSDLFKETWKTTKAMFEKPAEAWSLDEVQVVVKQ